MPGLRGSSAAGMGAGLEPLNHGKHFSKAQNFEKRYQFIQFNPGQLLKTPHTGKALPTVSCRNSGTEEVLGPLGSCSLFSVDLSGRR